MHGIILSKYNKRATKQANKQTSKQTSKQANKQTSKQANSKSAQQTTINLWGEHLILKQIISLRVPFLSMWTSSVFSRSNFWCKNDDALIEVAARQLEKYNARVHTIEGNSFPKLLHFIWLGSPLPAKYLRMINSWRFHHSSWEVLLWDDEKVETFTLVNAANFKHAPNYGMKSDILRYEILNSHGGVYVDIDYECIRSLDDIVVNCDFFVGFSHTEVLEINNGLIGCMPQHPIMQLLMKDITSQTVVTAVLQNQILADHIALFMGGTGMLPPPAKATAASSPTASETITLTGPGLLTRIIYQYFTAEDSLSTSEVDTDTSSPCTGRDQHILGEDTDRIVLFPVDMFHPVPNNVHIALQGEEEEEDTHNSHIEDLKGQFLTTNTIAIHWWQRSWQ